MALPARRHPRRRGRVRPDRRAHRAVRRRARTCCVGPGDDAAVLRVRDGPRRRLDRPARRGPALPPRLGQRRATSAHRAAAQNLSDINAMGGTRALADRRARRARRPAGRSGRSTSPTGFAEECALGRAPASSGGDLTRADEVVIAVTVLGACDGRRRCCARAPSPATCSRSPAGRAGRPPGSPCSAAASARPRVLVEAYRRPEPPYAAGPAAADAGRHRDDRRLRRAGRRRRPRRRRTPAWPSTSARDAFELPEPMQAVGARARRRPDAVRPRRRRRPRAARDLPRRRARARTGWTVDRRGRARATGVTVDGAAYDGADRAGRTSEARRFRTDARCGPATKPARPVRSDGTRPRGGR